MKQGGQLILATGVVLFFFMLTALLMMSDALQNSARFGQFYSVLLFFNTGGLLVLLVLIGMNLRQLLRQLRSKVAGARLTVRIVSMFAILAVTPVLIVYYFSLDFLHKGIDSWFDLRVEEALEDALTLSQLALDQRMKEILKDTERVANEFAEITNAAVPFEIDDYRLRSGSQELTVMTRQGGIIASSSSDTAKLVPDRPNEAVLFQLQQGSNYIGLDTIGHSGLAIRVVVNIRELGIETEPRIIQALFPVNERVSVLADNVQAAFVKYKELAYLREQLKLGFVLILTLVLLFSVFSALWAAFYSAARLAAPIRDLAEGTKSVADGDYNTQLPVTSRDELGFLVASFNEMTRRIAGARDAVRKSQQEAEAQRVYLEAVLGRLSSGVMVLDDETQLRTANISCGHILGIDIDTMTGQNLENISRAYPYLEPLTKTFQEHLRKQTPDWREQVVLFGISGRQILMCSGTSLSFAGEDMSVHVIVFDDITALIQGQRDAAWGEMARRLAHEIKNPLTPIQLAAERLRHKYSPILPKEQLDTLERLTNTIVQQVETMKDMVNTFSEYARAPMLSPEYVDLNVLIQETVDLYSSLDTDTKINLQLAPDLPNIKVDPGRMRRVFNNLLSNAFDASEQSSKMVLDISNRHITETGVDFIEVRIRDSGQGISEDIITTIFEPYVTTKKKGTGLGLAIVKKIIEEHGGIVWIENNSDGPGACVIIRLPVITVRENNSVESITKGAI